MGASRILIPVLVPLVYRGLTAWQENQANQRSRAAGLPTMPSGNFSNQGTELKGRVQAIRQKVRNESELGDKFRADVMARLDELMAAVQNSERMNDPQRRVAQDTIDRDINKLTAEIQAKIAGK